MRREGGIENTVEAAFPTRLRYGDPENSGAGRPSAALGAEALANSSHHVDQQLDFGERVVEVEARAGAGGDLEPVVERPGAMVAGADGDSLLVEELGDVVGVRLREREADEAGAMRWRWAEDVQA